jgi:hypothetical protein
MGGKIGDFNLVAGIIACATMKIIRRNGFMFRRIHYEKVW